MMVGVPGVGKSTFLKRLLAGLDEKTYIASTDDLIEVYAAKHGLTYSEAFHKCNQKQLKRDMEAGIEKAFHTKTSIFHDQTNMSRKSRASKLEPIPDGYFKICLNFTVDDKILLQRLDDRAKATGKVIPPFVLKNMFDNYDRPSTTEGFDLIIKIDNS